MQKTYKKYVILSVALLLGFVGMQTAFADVNISAPGPNRSVGNTNNGFFDNNSKWGDSKNWRCVARGRDSHHYRDYGSSRSRARDHALNYCEKHTRNCKIDSCNHYNDNKW